MNRLLRLSTLRHLRRHPWQSWLTVLGIALGVAVILAVDLANQSARQGFLLSAERLTGRANQQILGGPKGIPDTFYRQLRVELGLRRSAPVVEGQVRLGDQRLRLLGIDPLAEAPFRQFAAGLDRGLLRQLLTQADSLLLSQDDAARLGLAVGDRLTLRVAGTRARLRLIGLLGGEDPALREGLILTDIATAQELLGRVGRLDRIDLILEPAERARLQARLPPGLRLQTPASRTRMMAEMIEAFQINLSAMSLLAMLVGALLIYNTMTFSVLRRRRLLGTLRILGVTRAALFRLLLLEALLLGLIGTALGIGLGIFTAQYLLHLVTRTIDDLYFALSVSQLVVEPLSLLKGCLVGLGVTLLAALLPAMEAAATRPVDVLRRSLLESRLQRALPWLALSSLLALLAGWLFLSLSGRNLVGGFAGLFSLIIGYSLLTPLAVLGLGWLGGPLARRAGLLPRLALRGITANLSRSGLAIAALSVAVAAALGVGVMIGSFRATLADWLAYTLRSDLYLDLAEGAEGVLPTGLRGRIEALPEVAETSAGRRVEVESEYGPVELLALDLASRSQRGFRFARPPAGDLWRRYGAGELLLVSEPFAYRHRLHPGDLLRLQTDGGPLSLPIGGIFYDYGAARGLISLARSAYARLWDDPGISTIGVYLRPRADPGSVAAALRQLHGDRPPALRIRANREIRERAMAVFDRTFTITRVLRLLAIGVAFIGVLSALLALQLEHTREQAVLRTCGLTPGGLGRLILLETGLMGLYAGLLALPLGWLMSQLLIEVINRRAFGWSIFPQLAPADLLLALLLALGAALLAGLYPAWRVTRLPPALALREE